MTHCLSYDWMSLSTFLVWLCVSAVSLVVIIIICFDNGMIALFTLISQTEFSWVTLYQNRLQCYTAKCSRKLALLCEKWKKWVGLKTRPLWILWRMQQVQTYNDRCSQFLMFLFVFIWIWSMQCNVSLEEGVYTYHHAFINDTWNKFKIRLNLKRSIFKIHLYSNK